MLQVLQEKSIGLLDQVVKTLESYEQEDKRTSYFADRCIHKQSLNGHKEDVKVTDSDEKDGEDFDDVLVESEELPFGEKFKHLSFELLDIVLN